MKNEKYNGWTNRATWNVSLWIGNDEGLYRTAIECGDYERFVATMHELGSNATPDGVSWTDPTLNTDELDEMIGELS